MYLPAERDCDMGRHVGCKSKAELLCGGRAWGTEADPCAVLLLPVYQPSDQMLVQRPRRACPMKCIAVPVPDGDGSLLPDRRFDARGILGLVWANCSLTSAPPLSSIDHANIRHTWDGKLDVRAEHCPASRSLLSHKLVCGRYESGRSSAIAAHCSSSLPRLQPLQPLGSTDAACECNVPPTTIPSGSPTPSCTPCKNREARTRQPPPPLDPRTLLPGPRPGRPRKPACAPALRASAVAAPRSNA